jgi:hypothetical protein
MTRTKQFSLSQKEYTKIILKKKLRNSWWIYVIMLFVATFHFEKIGESSFSTFFVILAFTYPLISFAYLFFWTKSKGHKPIFTKTNLSFDQDFLYLERNNSSSKLSLNSFQKIIDRQKYWMLYLSKGQFIYVPKGIFFSDEDYQKFVDLIKTKKQ